MCKGVIFHSLFSHPKVNKKDVQDNVEWLNIFHSNWDEFFKKKHSFPSVIESNKKI